MDCFDWVPKNLPTPGNTFNVGSVSNAKSSEGKRKFYN